MSYTCTGDDGRRWPPRPARLFWPLAALHSLLTYADPTYLLEPQDDADPRRCNGEELLWPLPPSVSLHSLPILGGAEKTVSSTEFTSGHLPSFNNPTVKAVVRKRIYLICHIKFKRTNYIVETFQEGPLGIYYPFTRACDGSWPRRTVQ